MSADPLDHIIDEAFSDWMNTLQVQMGVGDIPLTSQATAASSPTELGLSSAIQAIVVWLKEMPTSRSGREHYIMDEQPVYYFGFLEATEFSGLVIDTAIFTLFAMVLLFYLTRLFVPSLRAQRQRLAWTLTFYVAVAFFSLSLIEVGYYRTPLFEQLGWSRVARDADHAIILTRWIEPATAMLAQWTQILVDKAEALATVISSSPSSSTAWSIESLQQLVFQVAAELADVARVTLKGLGKTPLFSSDPLSPPQSPPWISSSVLLDALPSSLSSWIIDRAGDGQQGWVSLAVFPHQSYATAIGTGLLLGYSIADVVLVPAIFQSFGHMFPRFRSTILLTTLFVLRNIFLAAVLHECLFNHPIPLAAVVALSATVLIHSVWTLNFVRVACQRKGSSKSAKVKEQSQTPLGGEDQGKSTSVQPRPATAASSASDSTFSLRTKSQQGKQKPEAKAKA
ncbi:hypothetical protein BGZ73_001883 [Actinomortierella ambigua]|nr:hypothetical protein BGZ73_001883 [Actinomortierella ambigua]